MKLRHRLTSAVLLAAFATTTALSAGVPQIKVPQTIKTPAAPPRVPAAPKVPVVKTPSTPKVPVVKTPVTPKVPVVKVPVVKTPPTPKVPVVKTPTVKTPPMVKTPVTPQVPAVTKGKQPVIVKVPATKPPVVKPATTVKTPASGPKNPTDASKVRVATPSSPKNESKTTNTSSTASSRMTTQSGKSGASDKNREVKSDLAEQLATLGFTDKEAAKISTEMQNPATRSAAQKAIQERADIEANRQLISSLVGDDRADEVAKKLADPVTRASTQTNLKLVLDAAANLQLAGVDPDKANRVTDTLIRTGQTDPKIVDEIVGRVILKDLTGQNAPQGDPDSETTTLDLVKTVLEAKASLQLVGASDDDKATQDAIEDIIKNRVTDPKKARQIVEVAATTVLEEQGLLPPATKPGETLKERLERAAEAQKEATKPVATKKPVKKPVSKKPSTLADSFKGRLAGVLGAEAGEGPANAKGSSPSVLELVFGTKKPRTNAPKGAKDGKLAAGGVRGKNVEGSGKGRGKGNGVGGKGNAIGNIVAKPGQVSQGVGTGTQLANDPDFSPVKDPNRSPNQPKDGTPVDNTTPPPAQAGSASPAVDGATGNAPVDNQELDSNPQQSGSTTPAGSNMDSGSTTFTVTDAPSTQADGTTTVGFNVTGSPGGADDGHYVTTYYPDGTYTTERVNADGSRETVGVGNGTPPNVKEGDSTNVTQGDQAVFAGDESGDNNNGGGNGNGNGNGDDDNDNDNGDPAATDDADAGDDAPAAAEQNEDTAEASTEGTPNPEAAERGSRGGRLAEATQGRLGGDEQRRQKGAIDQRKNGNGAGGPNPEGNTSSGVLFTAEEQKAFATLLGMKRGGGVTTPTENENSTAVTDRDLKDIAARRGSTINPANGGDGKGSGQTLGKKGVTPGAPAPAPAPKGVQLNNAVQAAPAAASAVNGSAVRVDSAKVKAAAR